VTEAELDDGFEQLEKAEHDLGADLGFVGVLANAVVSQRAPVPDLTVDVSGPGSILDQLGQRIFFSALQNVNVAQDDNGVTTGVSASGKEKIVTVFAKFDRALSDPRVDGNSLTVFFRRDESFKFIVAQGAEANAGTAIPPPLRSDAILLADVTRTFGQTQVLSSNISTARRQDAFVATGSPRSIRRGRTLEVIADLLTFYNAHASGTADRHPAAAVDYAGGGAWADGGTNPAATVEAQLDKVVADLSATSGAPKVGAAATAGSPNGLTAGTVRSQLDALLGFINSHINNASGAHAASATSYAGGGNWADGTTNPATTVEAQLDKVITDLAGASGADKLGAAVASLWADGTGVAAARVKTALDEIVSDLAATSGAPKVGAAATAGSPNALTAGSVRSQLDALLGFLNTHINVASGAHAASAISYAGSGNWKDATAVAATTVEAAIDEVVSDLAADAGAARIGTAARSNWLGGRTNPAGVSIFDAIEKVITDLAAQTATDDGAERIGAQASGNLAAGSVRSQLDAIDSTAVRTNVANTFTALQTLNGAAGDTNGAMATTAAPTTRKLLWEFAINASYKGRLYSSTTFNGSFEFTINARWDGANWVRDSASSPGLFAEKWTFHNYEWRVDVKTTSAASFSDSSWDGFFKVEFPFGAPKNITIEETGEKTSTGPLTGYSATEGEWGSTNANIGGGASFASGRLPAAPSSITFTVKNQIGTGNSPSSFVSDRMGVGWFDSTSGSLPAQRQMFLTFSAS
jgi:hypothetical protein